MMTPRTVHEYLVDKQTNKQTNRHTNGHTTLLRYCWAGDNKMTIKNKAFHKQNTTTECLNIYWAELRRLLANIKIDAVHYHQNFSCCTGSDKASILRTWASVHIRLEALVGLLSCKSSHSKRQRLLPQIRDRWRWLQQLTVSTTTAAAAVCSASLHRLHIASFTQDNVCRISEIFRVKE